MKNWKALAFGMVIAALGHRVGRVLGSVVAGGRDPTEAALALLEGMPLEGRMVTLDVGWMTQPVVRKEVEKGGATWGRSSGRSWKGSGAAKRSRAGPTGSGMGVSVKIGCMDGRSGRGSAGSGTWP